MWLRAILSSTYLSVNKLAAIVFACTLQACHEPTHLPDSDTVNLDSSSLDKPQRDAALSESCLGFNWSRENIDFVDAIPADSFRITEPIAIEFFTLAKRKDWFDSLDDNHQTYHRTLDQYGYYTARIRPIIENRGITVVDTLMNRTVLFFEDDKNEYIVDVGKWHHSDGVLFFTPGQEPFFWTDRLKCLICGDTALVNCYFGFPE